MAHVCGQTAKRSMVRLVRTMEWLSCYNGSKQVPYLMYLSWQSIPTKNPCGTVARVVTLQLGARYGEVDWSRWGQRFESLC